MNFFLTAAEAAPEALEGGGGLMGMLTMALPLVGMFALMYFLMIRPQKKREKQIQEMRSKLEVGDEVTTRGGVIGRVVSIQEDSIVIESGPDRRKMRIARWAIESNNTISDDTPEAK